MPTDLNTLFVYGTLKEGHLRSRMWPHAPQSIEPAMVRGQLLDLGSYPGLIEGDEWVLGELWTLAENHMPRTLAVLDQVEGYDAVADRGLYIRRAIPVWYLHANDDPSDQPSRHAFTYLIADRGCIAAGRHIRPAIPVDCRLAAQWPDSLSRVPTRLEDE
jgi:gamma-glutamylcyclotransferase (GGCT)/AIG2-like uncharacterized protein YtfP